MDKNETLSGQLASLKEEGYNIDFNLESNCLVCCNGQDVIYADEFVIDHYYRYEGESDPSDEAILYAITSEKYNLKGVLVNGYGIYAEQLASDMAAKLEIDRSKPALS